jgi:GNAT superfamily N-acetyltransferase
VDDAPVIEPLAAHHDRAAFACGEPALDAYIRRQAAQEVRRRIAQLFVAVTIAAPEIILGYHSLSAASFDKAELPSSLAKRLPHYPVPAAVLGRLAIALSHQRQGLGEMLLLDAVRRVLRASQALAVHAVVVDAKSERAVAFYARYGFRPFASMPRRLFFPLATFEQTGL